MVSWSRCRIFTDDLGFVGTQVTFWGVPADPRHDTTRGGCLEEDEGNIVAGSITEFVVPGAGKAAAVFDHADIVHGAIADERGRRLVGSTSGSSRRRNSTRSLNGAGEPYGQDGCNRLSFEPSISVAPDGQQASTPTGLTVDVHVGQEASLNPTGLADSTVKDTTVTLPEGVALNPAGADGLSACSTSQIALDSPEEQACPESAKVGTVEINTPLLPNPLVGAAYLATQNANPFGSLVALYFVAYDPVSGCGSSSRAKSSRTV